MNDRMPPPNFEETDALLSELFEETKKWEGLLSGGEETRLGPGAAAVESLLQTRISFGNPTNTLVALTPEIIQEAGIQLTAAHKQQMGITHDFYYMTLTVNMVPKPGAKFRMLLCQLDFGPKGQKEPIVQSIFPTTRWREVLKWGSGMHLGFNANLGWRAGVDTTVLTQVAQLPAEIQAEVVNKNDVKSFIEIPDYAYELGRFDIGATGEGNSYCRWEIQTPELQKTLTALFLIVFKVPRGTREITLDGTAWAEPSMNWLTGHLKNIFSDLSDKLQILLKLRDEAVDKFSRGVGEKWQLTLPQ